MSDKRNILDRLDDTISAIERHRAVNEKERANSVRKIDAAWAMVLGSARELRGKLLGNAQLRYLSIARDDLSVSISFRASSGNQRGAIMDLSRHHPDGKFPGIEAIWIRQPGEEDRRFENGDEVVNLMVRFCARYLTRD